MANVPLVAAHPAAAPEARRACKPVTGSMFSFSSTPTLGGQHEGEAAAAVGCSPRGEPAPGVAVEAGGPSPAMVTPAARAMAAAATHAGEATAHSAAGAAAVGVGSWRTFIFSLLWGSSCAVRGGGGCAKKAESNNFLWEKCHLAVVFKMKV